MQIRGRLSRKKSRKRRRPGLSPLSKSRRSTPSTSTGRASSPCAGRTDVPGGYGRKGSINADQMAAISALEPEIVTQKREILLAAKDRAEGAELIVLKPQSKKRAGVVKRSE